jgi:hypothetical protein
MNHAGCVSIEKGLMLKKTVFIGFSLLLLAPTVAFSADWNAFSGYGKSLATFSKTTGTEEGTSGSLNRARLEWKPKINDQVDLNLTYDHEFFYNDFANTPEFGLIRQNNQKNLAYLDLDRVISDTNHFYEKHGLYRAYVRVTTEHARTTVGKQLIDWGRMRAWSPLDAFNQPLPTSLEPEERVGFDAIYTEIFKDPFSGVSFIYGPGNSESETSFGARAYKKFGTYDLAFVVTKHQEDKLLGFGFDGYLKDAGFRGEFTYTKNGKNRFPRAALGLDYSFPKEITVALEYFYNGAANGDYAAYSDNLKLQQYQMSLKKNLISLSATWEISPLWKFKNFFVFDIDGRSAFFNPEIRYSIKENFDAAIGAQLFVESTGSEFEGNQNLCYTELKYFF